MKEYGDSGASQQTAHKEAVIRRTIIPVDMKRNCTYWIHAPWQALDVDHQVKIQEPVKNYLFEIDRLKTNLSSLVRQKLPNVA